MSDAAYYRAYRQRPEFKDWSARHEATPRRKAARRAARARWKLAHPDHVATSHTKRRAAGVAAVRAAKDRPCADCGEWFPPMCMDFDHRPGEVKHPSLAYTGRKVPVSMTSLACTNLEVFLEEAKKCDVVCANCHRLRTWVRRCGDHKLDETKL